MTYELLYNLEKEQYVWKAPWHITFLSEMKPVYA